MNQDDDTPSSSGWRYVNLEKQVALLGQQITSMAETQSERHVENKKSLADIYVEVKTTNGKVRGLEAWRDMVQGGLNKSKEWRDPFVTLFTHIFVGLIMSLLGYFIATRH